jgi:hypothetical protein
MFTKKFCTVAGTLAALSISALAVAPAKAQDVSETQARDSVNAMYGHSLRMHLQEMDPEAVVVGRVVRKSGDLIGVRFMWPESVEIDDREYTNINVSTSDWHVVPGSDVVLAYKDGMWHFLSDEGDTACVIDWITRLNLKAVSDVEKVSIDWGTSQPVALPPVQPSTVQAPVPAPEQPIRGMW